MKCTENTTVQNFEISSKLSKIWPNNEEKHCPEIYGSVTEAGEFGL